MTLRRWTLEFEGSEAAFLVKMPGRSEVYTAIAQAGAAGLVERKTTSREVVPQRGVWSSLPDAAAHLDVVRDRVGGRRCLMSRMICTDDARALPWMTESVSTHTMRYAN